MIKIYKLRQLRNNVSLVLVGKNGNTMRYNFTNGNVSMGVYPSISLRNKYAQDLLEESELFERQDVVLDRTIKTAEDDVVLTPKEDSPKKEDAWLNTQATSAATSVTTPDELLAYVNDTYSKRFSDPAKALAFAAKEGEVFPNLKIGE